MDIYCVIMAGGRGERFWPKSRQKKPKQFLDLLGPGTLLEQTVLRVRNFVSKEKIFIITGRDYVKSIQELFPGLPPENVIGEPCGRDTAPCMALAAGIIKAVSKDENPVMILLPSDHFILNSDAMTKDFLTCAESAVRRSALATIGIEPTFPSPDYGYIECGEVIDAPGKIHAVKNFREKPSVETANTFLARGNYKWNSGIFVFPVKVLTEEMRKNAPDLLNLAESCAEKWGSDEFPGFLEEAYPAAQKISLDYAIMEHASEIIVKSASFDWDDVGNWTSLRKHLPKDENGNIQTQNTVLLDSRNCIVYSDDPDSVITGIDLDDMVIVKAADAVLVTPAKSLGKIKKMLSTFNDKDELKKFL